MNWWAFPDREFRLRERIAEIRDDYRFILIDCPPALDLLTLNALMAADSVLVPIQCEFFALEGISELMDTIDRIRDSFNHPLKVEGILLTMFDDRTNLTRQVAADLQGVLRRRRSFKTIIPAQHPPCRSAQLRQAHPQSTTPVPAALKATSNSPKRFWTMNKTDNPRRALGKGLGALLPTRAPTSPRRGDPLPAMPSAPHPIDSIDPNPLAAPPRVSGRTPR